MKEILQVSGTVLSIILAAIGWPIFIAKYLSSTRDYNARQTLIAGLTLSTLGPLLVLLLGFVLSLFF